MDQVSFHKVSGVLFNMSQVTSPKICFTHHLGWFFEEIMNLIMELLNYVYSNFCYTKWSRKLVILLYMGHVIYVWNWFFNVNSMVVSVL